MENTKTQSVLPKESLKKSEKPENSPNHDNTKTIQDNNKPKVVEKEKEPWRYTLFH
jgi:hypothetical protein